MSSNKPVILVVEDEQQLLKAVKRKLTDHGLEPIACDGGEKAFLALAKLAKNPEIIWLDYHLQDMDGVIFMNKLKANKKWQDIPVVVVSNSAGPENIDAMMDLGAKEYIVKAASRLDDIVTQIKQMIKA